MIFSFQPNCKINWELTLKTTFILCRSLSKEVSHLRSVILKGTEIAFINSLILSGQTSHKILKLCGDYGGGENGWIVGGRDPWVVATACATWPASLGMTTSRGNPARFAGCLQELACITPRPGCPRRCRRCAVHRSACGAGCRDDGWQSLVWADHRSGPWLIFLFIGVLIKYPKHQLRQDLAWWWWQHPGWLP